MGNPTSPSGRRTEHPAPTGEPSPTELDSSSLVQPPELDGNNADGFDQEPTPPYPLHRPELPIAPWATAPLRSYFGIRSGVLALIALTVGVFGVVILAVILTIKVLQPLAPEPASLPALPTTVIEIREVITQVNTNESSASFVAEKVVPSIVTVEIGHGDNLIDFDAFGSGSGVVLSNDGLIVTNHHVIANANRIRVILQDGRIYAATLVGSDPLTDLAILSVEAQGFPPIELGTTNGISIGETAIAVGNPLGLRGGASLTVGVLSAFGREVDLGDAPPLVGMLQTDAPITQGSSGGALVDTDGRLIGITTAIGMSSAGAEGIGFAIPVELVERITKEIIATGSVRHAFLGIELQEQLEQQADGSHLPIGTVITGFASDASAAQAAGLKVGDRIVRFDGNAVQTRNDLIIRIRQYRVGDIVEVQVMRDGDLHIAEVALGERPSDL